MMDLEWQIHKIILDFASVLIDNKKDRKAWMGHLIYWMPCDKEKEYFFCPSLDTSTSFEAYLLFEVLRK